MSPGNKISSRLFTAKSWITRGQSHQPAFMGSCVTLSQMCLPCAPSRLVSLCVLCLLIIGLMVVLLTLFWAGDYGFSTLGVGVTIGNWCGIKGKFM